MSDYAEEYTATEGDKGKETKPFLSDRVYDKLKFIAQILLPALGTAYFGLAGIWGLPKADEVVGTIVVVDTLLGALLVVSTRQYNSADNPRFDGDLFLMEGEEPGMRSVGIGIHTDAQTLEGKKDAVFKVHTDETIQ